MNLSSLETFLAIVDTGSLVKASKQLYLTQSTITARLQALEQELGQTLIVRQKSGVSLTTAGERLYRYASTITGLWRQAKQEASLPGGVSIVCNIGCHPDLWPNLGELFFDYIKQHFSDAALSVWHCGQSELNAWINSGKIDVSISYVANAQGNHNVHELGNDKLMLVSTSAEGPIRFNPDYIFVESGEEFGREHAAAYADADTAKLSFGNADLGLKYILQHGGSAYLPLRITQPYIDSKQLFVLHEAPVFERKIFLVVSHRTTQELDVDALVKDLTGTFTAFTSKKYTA